MREVAQYKKQLEPKPGREDVGHIGVIVLTYGSDAGEGQNKPEIQVEKWDYIPHIQHSLNITEHYYVSNSVLGSRTISENKADKNPSSHGA